MSTKKRSIQWKKDGSEKIEYRTISDDGITSSCSPSVWHALKLEDTTTAQAMESAAEIRYRAKRNQMRDLVDDNAWLRTQSPCENRYQLLCNHVGIRY